MSNGSLHVVRAFPSGLGGFSISSGPGVGVAIPSTVVTHVGSNSFLLICSRARSVAGMGGW